MKDVKLTQSANVLSTFSSLHLVRRGLYQILVVFNEEIIQNLRVKTEETIATLEQKDEDVC